MKFILLIVLNASSVMIPNGSMLPAASIATATFETEAACRDAMQTLSELGRAAQIVGNLQARCVPAGEPEKK